MIRQPRLLWAALVGLLAAPAAGAERADADSEPLVGLWAAEVGYGPELRGTLVLQRTDGRWTARIGGMEASSPDRGEALRVDFPGGRGALRGRLAADGQRIDGFWIQPSGESEDRPDPGGSGQSFATPLTLGRAGPELWRGTVVPLDDRFTLYLSVFRENGALAGAFRNPESNSNGGASRFRVTREGGTVRFHAPSGGGEIVHEATLLPDPARLRLAWPGHGRAIELMRREPDAAASFHPRPPDSPPHVYRPPARTHDGWETARAGDTGLDEAALERLVQDIARSDPAARRPNLIHSLLVAHRGRLVLEEYFFGHDADTPHDIRSAGKTFASVMLGALMMRGAALSPETRVYDLFEDRGPFAHPDPRKAEISLAHLMTHTAGLACDDNDPASPGNESTLWTQAEQPDWWRYTLDLPMAHDPGRRYAYCSANINLVGGALSVATDTRLPELFDETVARPLGFGRYHWNLAADGEGYLGGGAFVRPRDLLKLGQAYLDGGVWRGRRLVDSDWVARSTEPVVAIDEETTGLDPEAFANAYAHGRDALAWHVYPLSSGGRAYRAYSATGNGGQILLVVPELELAVVFTGGNYRQGGIWGRWSQEIVGDRIIPAIMRRAAIPPARFRRAARCGGGDQFAADAQRADGEADFPEEEDEAGDQQQHRDDEEPGDLPSEGEVGETENDLLQIEGKSDVPA